MRSSALAFEGLIRIQEPRAVPHQEMYWIQNLSLQSGQSLIHSCSRVLTLRTQLAAPRLSPWAQRDDGRPLYPCRR